MQVSSNSINLNAMSQAQTQMGDLAQKVSDATNPAIISQNRENQEVTPDLINAITQQIPTQIAYEASGTAIKVENAIQDTILNIKA